MSRNFGLTLLAGSIALLGAAPAFAASTPSPRLFAAGSAMETCATAARNAEVKNTATDSDLAACTMAVRMPDTTQSNLAAAYANRGVLHLVRAEYEDSIADSNAALLADGGLPEAVVNRGVALLLEHRPIDAAADFTRALGMDPAHRERVYFNRAMAREDMGDLKGAYADYRQASELNPQWDRPKQELARFTVRPAKPLS